MKELYIPRGKTVTMASVDADRIVARGTLNVDGTIKARKIMGGGIVRAGHISCQSVVADDIEAGTVTARHVAVDRLVAVELRASKSVAVTCYLEAGMVVTPKLTARHYEVQELSADQIVRLPDRPRGLLFSVLTSELRTGWSALRCWWHDMITPSRDEVLDAEYTVQEDAPKVLEAYEPDYEFERKRLLRMFDLARNRGYVLRVCTQEEAQSPMTETLLREAAKHKAA